MVTRGAHRFAWNGELPGAPESAGIARRLITDLLMSWGHDSRVDTATLLVSEIVTNAILHAGSDIYLRVTGDADSVRVEVADQSTALPSPRPWGDDAVTGHGLEMVEMLATSWGVDSADPGKRVWFELGTPPEDAGEGPAGLFDEASGDHHSIRLLGLPTDLVLATFEYGDALLRELALLNLGEDRSGTEPSNDANSKLDLSGLLAGLSQAVAQRQRAVDIDVDFPAESASAALDRLALVDEAQRLASDGLLLAMPAVPEIAACRRWLLGEIALQVQGADPTRWVLPEPVRERELTFPLDAAEREIIAAGPASVLVADNSNRILYADTAVADLLGWVADDLVGYRLTTLIPPEFREAHLGGFTRFLLTGESNIVGVPTEVPALRRDGSQVPVRLLIEIVPGGGDRRLLRAQVQRA